MDALAITTAVLTLVLVIITGWYAYSTRQMVSEMQRSREQSQRPAMSLTPELLGPQNMAIRASNIGTGSALEPNLRVVFEPRASADEWDSEPRPWHKPVVRPGDSLLFFPPNSGQVDWMSANVESVSLAGTVRDSLGTVIDVDERVDDIAGWLDRLRESNTLLPPDPFKDLARDMRKNLKALSDEVKRVREVLDGTHAAQQARYRALIEERERAAQRPVNDDRAP